MKKRNKVLLALILGSNLTGAVSANKKGNTDKYGGTEKCEAMKCGAGKCGASMNSADCDEQKEKKGDDKKDTKKKK